MSGLIVSVSGVRGVVGSGLTPSDAVRFGQAFATLLEGGTVAVGRDTRPSGEMVRSAAVAGLLAGGCRIIELGIASTPATGLMTRRLGCQGGLVITASHNPIGWNGLKFLRPSGTALASETGQRLREIAESGDFRTVAAPDIPPIREDFRDLFGWASERLMQLEDLRSLLPDQRAALEHVRSVLDVTEERATVASRRFKVVLDPVNGAGSLEGSLFLTAMGCTPIVINERPTGMFARPPEPTAEHLVGLCEAVRRHKADVGFGMDPDADRLAAVDETGRYLGEEATLALSARYVLSRRPGPLAANLSTSRMIDDLAAAAGVPVHRTPVGEAHVADAIERFGCVLGGEGNGGVIDPRVVPVRDALTAMALILQLLAREGRPISQLADSLPQYAMVKTKFECTSKRAGNILSAVQDHFAGGGAALNNADGVRVDLPEGWVHVRPSNTEPIFRIIAEARTRPAAEELVRRVRSIADGH